MHNLVLLEKLRISRIELFTQDQYETFEECLETAGVIAVNPLTLSAPRIIGVILIQHKLP